MATTFRPDGHAAGHSILFMHHLEKIAQSVYSAKSVEEILQSLVNTVSSLSPWSMCWVGLVRDEIGDDSQPQFYAGFREGGRFTPQPIISMKVVRSGKPMYFSDILEASREFPFLAQDSVNLGVRSALIVPLEVGNSWGVLWICTPDPHEYTADQITLAMVIASLAAVAFRNVVSAARARKRQVEAADELKKLNSVITMRNAQLQQLATVQETLIRILLADEGIERIAAAISDLLDTPVVLLDRFYQVVAYARVSQDRAAELCRNFRPARAATSIPASDPLPRGVTLQGESYLASPVLVAGETVAWVLGVTPSDASDMVVAFEHACLIVALEFLKERRRIESEIRVQRDFADALLSADPSTNANLSVRAGHLGIRFDTTNQVLRTHLSRISDLQLRTEESDEIAKLVRSKLLANHKNVAVISLGASEFLAVVPEFPPRVRGTPSDPCTAIRNAVTSALVRYAPASLKKIPISIAIGSPYPGADGLKRSLSEANRTLEILAGLGLDDADLAFSESGSYSLLSTMGGPDREAFMSRYVQPIVAYDEQHRSQLIRTLEVFFEALGNVQKTADVLYLHVSSVRYRLSRIETILGISLNNHDDRLCLQLGVILLRLSGRPTTLSSPSSPSE